MATLLEKRQLASIKSLLSRKTKAETYVAQQREKTELKLAPYLSELEVVNKMLDDHRKDTPQLFPEEQPTAPAHGEEGGQIA